MLCVPARPNTKATTAAWSIILIVRLLLAGAAWRGGRAVCTGMDKTRAWAGLFALAAPRDEKSIILEEEDFFRMARIKHAVRRS
jgi:hypothetical protein